MPKAGGGGDHSFATKDDYLIAAAQSMSRILVDHARVRNTAKRGGSRYLELESDHLAVTPRDDSLKALDEVLSRLAFGQPELAELVRLRHFGGLTLAECAEVLEVSCRTADVVDLRPRHARRRVQESVRILP
jgi:DNA-directed RNA polymerase specialized sigma24 family protein